MIDTQAIRSKILDLAMRGKLTEQLPEDGTAEELYQWLQTKKQTLIRDRKLKKAKPLPEISVEEDPFDLPSNWRWVRLGELCTKIVDGDHNPPAGVQETTEYLMLSAQNINEGKLCNLDKVRHLSAAIFEEENKRTQLEVDDVLLTIVGTIGRTCVYQGGYNICFQRSVAVISTLIDSRYLKCALDIPFVQNFMEANATGAAQLGFYLKKLEKLLIPLPPLAEQKRIVSRIEQAFSALDTIDALQAKYADNLAVLKSKMIDAAIQGKLTEQLPEDGTAEELYRQIQAEKQALITAGKIKKEKPLPEIEAECKECFDIPESWRWTSVGSVCINIQYGSSKKSSSSGKMAVLRMGNIQAGKIVYDDLVYTSDDDEIVKHPLDKDDLLFNRTNSMELVGKAAIYKGEKPAIYAGYLVRLTPLGIVSEYLNYVMQSKYYWDYCRTVRIDSNGQSNINAEKLKRFVFPLPPLAEQKRIVKQLDTVLTIVGA